MQLALTPSATASIVELGAISQLLQQLENSTGEFNMAWRPSHLFQAGELDNNILNSVNKTIKKWISS